MVEGVGLLIFQQVNWENWGPTIHLSEQIVWISPIVDVLFFSLLAMIVVAVARVWARVPQVRGVAILLTTLAVYDWLTLTARLQYRARALLAIGVGVAFSRWLFKHEAWAMRFWKRTLPWAVAAFVLALAGIQGSRWIRESRNLANLPAAPSGAPNVLVIVVDTLRADHLSAYGYARPTSPNLDRLAREGVLFENAISPSPWTFPSHVSLLTGRYQFQHGMEQVQRVRWLGVDRTSLNGNPMIGDELRQLGYRTGAFSANRTFFTSTVGFGRGFMHFADYFYSPADMLFTTVLGQEAARIYVKRLRGAFGALGLWMDFDPQALDRYSRKRARTVNQELLHWIDAGPAEHPFFAFLNYYDVHAPYGGPPSFPRPNWPQNDMAGEYDSGIAYVDDSIGQLMAGLEKRGLTRNTVVVITSDHGESLGEHGMKYHGNALYLSQLHVPLIFWYPRHIPQNVRVPVPVSNASLAATLLSLIDPETSAPFPLPSLAPLWQSPRTEQNWPTPLSEVARQYAEPDDPGNGHLVPMATAGPMKSLLSGQWHLIVHKEFGYQLYDWVHDPAEVSDLIWTPTGQQIASDLTLRMEDVLAESAGRDREATPLVFHDTRQGIAADVAQTSTVTGPTNDQYRVKANSGSVVSVAVRVRDNAPSRQFDPVVSIIDAKGEILRNCRNPSDDNLALPGKSDSTPNAFDDICVYDEAEHRGKIDPPLEMLVPGESGSTEQLIIRVSDWDGRARRGAYQVTVTGESPDTAGALAGTQ